MREPESLISKINNMIVHPNSLAIWGLGQMGVVIKDSRQKIIYIDPVLTDVVSRKIPEMVGLLERAFPPPVQPEEITHADYVFCTHEHYDHTDPFTLGPLAKASPQARFLTNSWSASLLDEAGITANRRIILRPGQVLDLDGLQVHIIPAGHYQVENDPQKGTRWMSLLLDWGDITFFHSGDAILYPGYMETIRALPKADVGMLAVNGRDLIRDGLEISGNLLPVEAAWLADQLSWDVLLAGHNDLFPLNSIPAGDLFNVIQKTNPLQKVHYIRPGELFYYSRG